MRERERKKEIIFEILYIYISDRIIYNKKSKGGIEKMGKGKIIGVDDRRR